MNQANDNEENTAGEIDIDKMKRYIAYCKSSAFLTSYLGSQKPHALIENVPHVLLPRLRTRSARISLACVERFSRSSGTTRKGALFQSQFGECTQCTLCGRISHVAVLVVQQSTGSNHTYLRVARENRPVSNGARASRSRSDAAVQNVHNGCRFRIWRGRSIAWCPQRRHAED
jgi:hypothetical protein